MPRPRPIPHKQRNILVRLLSSAKSSMVQSLSALLRGLPRQTLVHSVNQSELIDLNSGELILDNGRFLLGPGLSLEDFKKSKFFSGAKPSVINPPYESYVLQNMGIGAALFDIVIFFEGNGLCQITMCMNIPQNRQEPRREQSSAIEDLRKEMHDQFLIENRIATGVFSWGELESGYDPRGDFSSIVLRFHHR